MRVLLSLRVAGSGAYPSRGCPTESEMHSKHKFSIIRDESCCPGYSSATCWSTAATLLLYAPRNALHQANKYRDTLYTSKTDAHINIYKIVLNQP